MNNDLVTVAIPAYNHQDYVQETIISIISQTHKNLELVIFNDGSSDDTDTKIRELLPECEKRFVRLEYINKQNEGIAATWNKAIDWANGDYFYTIASDDVAMPHAIEMLYKFLSRHRKYAIAVGDNQIIDEKSQRCGWDLKRNNIAIDRAEYHTFGEYLKHERKDFNFNASEYGSYRTLIKGNYITNGKLFRKQAMMRIGKYKSGMLEDWYMNLQLSKHYRIKFLDTILLSYRWHNNNAVKNRPQMKARHKAVLEYEKQNYSRWFEKYAEGEKPFISRCRIDMKYALRKIARFTNNCMLFATP